MLVGLEMSEDEFFLIAQFIKRVTWEGVRSCAVDKIETEQMICAINEVRHQLEQAGISVR